MNIYPKSVACLAFAFARLARKSFISRVFDIFELHVAVFSVAIRANCVLYPSRFAVLFLQEDEKNSMFLHAIVYFNV